MAAFGIANRFSTLSKSVSKNKGENFRESRARNNKRGSVTGAEPDVLLSRLSQIQRRETEKRRSSLPLEELQSLWKADVPPPVDPKLEEELRVRQSRLTQLIEVNRALHHVLVKKKIAAIELEEKSEDLQSRLEATLKVEEPAQRKSQRELEDLLREEKTKCQATNEEFYQMNIECEERVRDLQEASRRLQEVNGNNRKLIKEQAMEIKERQKAIKDLQRHVHLVEGAESEKEDKLMPLLDRQYLIEREGSEGSRLAKKRSSQEESSCGDATEQEEEEEEESVASEPLTFSRLNTDRKLSIQGYAAPGEKRPTSARRTLATAVTVKGTAAGYRRLPGLNLERLLGVGNNASPPASPTNRSS